MVCKQKMFFWRCGRCTVAAHTKCAPWPLIHLKDDEGSAICWRHPSDWLLQNEVYPSASLKVGHILLSITACSVHLIFRQGGIPFYATEKTCCGSHLAVNHMPSVCL
jgi:hypothetical protein